MIVFKSQNMSETNNSSFLFS
uniref:Uncharacterized protein n=1 Tax=Anguilla anguilla TaxID=7936 RepID=A0A0E9UIP0_ANGAN